MKREKCSIFWFRRDLRLKDNIALYHALLESPPTLPIFIFDKTILNNLEEDDKRVKFIYETIRKIKDELNQKGSDLIVFHETPLNAFQDLISKYSIKAVYSNEDYEPKAIQRDLEIKNLLLEHKIDFHQFKDQCIFSKNDIIKKDGRPYTVFTPYKKKWYESISNERFKSVNPNFKNLISLKKTLLPSLKSLGFKDIPLPEIVNTIKSSVIKNYDQNRNYPSRNGTSLLGIHLRFGTISVRKCAQIGQDLNLAWLDEIIWREFFMQILWHFPYVESSPFKKKYEKIQWRNNREDFHKWCNGITGYPLVDAGMRELNETGHMHNRVRMLTASFLVKHLLIDWRWGEKYFASKLLDFDMSANNGNWQWAAGCGCDAAPYFRIFNPYTQLEKFDPEMTYVKKWIPELNTTNYPKEMVNHKFAYARAIETFKKGLS